MIISRFLGVYVLPNIDQNRMTNLLHEAGNAFLWVIHMVKKEWKLYDLEMHEIIVSRDVLFYKHIYPFSLHQNGQLKSASSPMLEIAVLFGFPGNNATGL